MKEFDAILNVLTQTNWIAWGINLIVIILAFLFLSDLFEKFMAKIGLSTKGMRKKKEMEDLLNTTAKTVENLVAKESKDTSTLYKGNQEINTLVKDFMCEMRKDMAIIKVLHEENTNKINELASKGEIRDNAMMQTISDRIIQRSRIYIHQLKGIPSNEYTSMVKLYESYKSLGGNGGISRLYSYVMDNLPILPVDEKEQNYYEKTEKL